MSKRFVGKPCVYCGGERLSSTRDHIFARQFFPSGRRISLPMVAACQPCNNAKSVLEHYLTTVMPFGGRHSDSTAVLEKDVPRRLAKNQRLHQQLIDGRHRIAVREGDAVTQSLAFPFDSQKLVDLFAYVARGLTAFHWGVVIPPTHQVEALLLNPVYEPNFRELFLMRANARVNGLVGDGAFRYQGAQGVDDPAMTMWRFQAFGGVVFAGGEHRPEPGAHTVWVTSGRDLEPLE